MPQSLPIPKDAVIGPQPIPSGATIGHAATLPPLEGAMQQFRKHEAENAKAWANPPVLQGAKEIAAGNISKGANIELGALGHASLPAIAVFAPELVPAVAAAPLATATTLGTSALAGMAAKHLGVTAAEKMGLSRDQSQLAGNILSLAGAYAGYKGGSVLSNAARDIRSAIADWAQEEPDKAALQGVGVKPSSKYAQRVLRAIKTVRPYMKGVSSELQLQERIPLVKQELWAPYAKAVSEYGNVPIKVAGQEPITLAQAESERLRLSAINDAARNKDPIALQKIEQAGRTVAESLKYEKALDQAIDDKLESLHVPSREIRTRYGRLTEVQKRVQGKLSGMVKAPYGLGRVFGGARGGGGVGESGEFRGHGFFLTERLANILPAINDILADRPWWSGSPTDINIAEGFRGATEAPFYPGAGGSPAPAGLLQAAPIFARSAADVSTVRGIPAIPEPPEAIRKGRLLPAGEATGPHVMPPSELSAVAGSEPTPTGGARGYPTGAQPEFQYGGSVKGTPAEVQIPLHARTERMLTAGQPDMYDPASGVPPRPGQLTIFGGRFWMFNGDGWVLVRGQ